MVDAFATAAEFGKRVRRTFSAGEETEWITQLLEDASTYLREDVLGAQIYPPTTSTFTTYPDVGGEIPIPQQPATVLGVTRNGGAIEWQSRDGYIQLADSDRDRSDVEVTLKIGLDDAPDSLKRWACVLVSQILVPLELKLGLTVGGLSSIQIDDFRAAFANAGEESGITLSDRNIALIRRQWSGGAAHVTETR